MLKVDKTFIFILIFIFIIFFIYNKRVEIIEFAKSERAQALEYRREREEIVGKPRRQNKCTFKNSYLDDKLEMEKSDL